MTLAEIAETLTSADSEERRLATMELARTTGDEAEVVRLLMRCLADNNWRVREEAVRVGAHLVNCLPAVQPCLLDALCQDDNVGLRNAAVAVFGAAGPAAVEVLSKALQASPENARKFLVEALANTGVRQAVAVLLDTVKDADHNLMAASIDALAVVGGPEAEAALTDMLALTNAFQRMAALDALNRLGAVVPWDTLHPLFDDRTVWRVAVPAMGRCRDERAVTPLMTALAERSERMLSELVAAVAQLCGDVPSALDTVEKHMLDMDNRVKERVVSLLGQSDGAVRLGVALLLVCARDLAAIESLMALMGDDDLPQVLVEPSLRWGAELIELLLDRHGRVSMMDRGVALRLASQLVAAHRERGRSAQVADAMVRLQTEVRSSLRHGDEVLRLAAARALLPFAERTDAPLLVQAATGKDWDLSDVCGQVLWSLAEREPAAVRTAVAEVDLCTCDQDLIAELVARLDPERAFARLDKALNIEDPGIRCAAVAGLGVLGGTQAAQRIASVVNDVSLMVQLRAVEALGCVRGEHGEPLGLPYLRELLGSDDAELRAAVVHSLGELGEGPIVEIVERLVQDSAPVVQVAVLQALRRLEAPQVADRLLAALDHNDAEVVKHALEGLHEQNPELARPHVERALNHARWDVRRLVVKLVAKYGDMAAMSTLRYALVNERDDLVRRTIEAHLQEVRKVA